MHGYGHGTVGLLLSMVAGYWVIERASTHKGRLRSLGQLVGGIILIVALVGTTCRVWATAAGACKGRSSAIWCPWKPGATQPPVPAD
jgi:hypothetical protein